MFLRTVKSKTKSGMREYLQLCHNYREDGTSKTKVLYNFGRKDQVDPKQIRRLIHSFVNLLPEEERAQIHGEVNRGQGFQFIGSKELGGTYFLDQIWKRLQMDKKIMQLLDKRGYNISLERLIFGMVAHCALNPSSEITLEQWVDKEAYIPNLREVKAHQLYRAMDFLLETSELIQEDVFFSMSALLNLEIDLIFLVTTTMRFAIAQDEEEYNQLGFHKRISNEGQHLDYPQRVMAIAVSPAGIPVRCWVWPASTNQPIFKEVKKDLKDWKLHRVVMVQDSGLHTPINSQIQQGSMGHFIIGEKIRIGQRSSAAAARKGKGRFKTMENGLQIKDATIQKEREAQRRSILVRDPKEAEYDKKKRYAMMEEVQQRLEELKQLERASFDQEASNLQSHSTYSRYIRATKTGRLGLDKTRIKEEEMCDGTYLISATDESLSDEEMIEGYQQLLVIEQVYQNLKHVIGARSPNYLLEDHRKAQAILCWMAMLLIRIIENEADITWSSIKRMFLSHQLAVIRSLQGDFQESSPLSLELKRLYTLLKVNPPPRYF